MAPERAECLPECETSTEGYIRSTDGVALYYRIAGSGADTVLVIHGGPGLSIYYLEPDLRPLTENYTVIYYDQRGAGKSTMLLDSASLHINTYIADLEEVRRYFGIDRLQLFGHSWGAVLGARYLYSHPDNISRLVMVSPGPVRYDPYEALFFPRVTEWMDRIRLSRLLSLHTTFVAGEGDIQSVCREFTALFKRGYFYDPFDLETFSRMRGDICSAPDTALRTTWTVNALTLQSMGKYDWRLDYRDIGVPVLIVAGERDIFPEKTSGSGSRHSRTAVLYLFSVQVIIRMLNSRSIFFVLFGIFWISEVISSIHLSLCCVVGYMCMRTNYCRLLS